MSGGIYMKPFLFFIFISFFVLLHAESFRIGYDTSSLDNVSKKDFAIASDVWLNEVAKEAGMTAISTIYDDPAKMAQDMKDNKLDLVIGFGLVFVKYFDLSLFTDGFGQGFFNGQKETFVVLVQKNSGIKKIEDLKSGSIAIQQNDESAELYIEDVMYKKYKDPKVLFDKYPTRQRALLKLFFGKSTAAVITNKSFEILKELNPQISQKIEILTTINLQANSFGLLRKSLNLTIKEKLVKIALNVHKTPRGKELLALYKTEKIAISKVDDLKPFDVLYKDSLQFKKKGK